MTIGEASSKFEKYFATKISRYYPNLNVVLNDRNTLSGLELDILIPKIKLAIEIQGTHHYKPIGYGKKSIEAHKRTVESDKRKRDMCKKLKIKLMAMDIHRVRAKDKETLNMMSDMILSEIRDRLTKLK